MITHLIDKIKLDAPYKLELDNIFRYKIYWLSKKSLINDKLIVFIGPNHNINKNGIVIAKGARYLFRVFIPTNKIIINNTEYIYP
jgi:hypothetical protein